MFQVVTPASDLSLLTVEELRVAVGRALGDASQDAALATLGSRVTAMITKACRVNSDGVNPATLLLEGCRDSFRLVSSSPYLYLSRRPVQQVTSITEAGADLAEDVDFEIDAAGGRLIRLCSDAESTWRRGRIVVEYDAGFDPVPDDLKAIAAQLAGGYWADNGADPMEKSLSIPGVIETTRWVDQNANGQMPSEVFDALNAGGYVNKVMVF
jgi:hypothetical protein